MHIFQEKTGRVKIVADDKIPFLKGVLEPYADVIYVPGGQISGADIRDADALLVRTRTKCNESLLRDTDVRFIGTATIGYDHIDTEYCQRKNIRWANAPGCNSTSVQQYVTAVLLTLEAEKGFKLKDKTIGIIGAGNVGSKVEKNASALGMRVLINDPPRERREGKEKFVTFDTILNEADIITLHVPLNRTGPDKTQHLFSDKVLRMLRKRIWLINSSRGEVVETEALKEALKEGILSGVILDVWEKEPDIDRELLNSAFIATPHIAGYSADGKANGTSMIIKSLSEFFDLPLTDWYPSGIPLPDEPVISADCSEKDEDSILKEAVRHTYDVQSDDRDLRLSPEAFERLRGNYRSRREFTSYTVLLSNCNTEFQSKLEAIGFRIMVK